MIPRAIEHIFTSTAALREQGWSYEFEGQYLEIVRILLPATRDAVSQSDLPLDARLQYNEQVNDLLGSGEIDKKKHEIKHEKVGKVMRTTVTDAAIGGFPLMFVLPRKADSSLTSLPFISQDQGPQPGPRSA